MPYEEFLYFRIDASVASDAPYAENDEFLRTPGEGVDIPAPAVLANDGDPNGLPITATPVDPATHGDVTLNAVMERNYPTIQGAVLLIALIFMLVNILTDSLYAVLDPRVRLSGR